MGKISSGTAAGLHNPSHHRNNLFSAQISATTARRNHRSRAGTSLRMPSHLEGLRKAFTN